jgi:hypothetical protein
VVWGGRGHATYRTASDRAPFAQQKHKPLVFYTTGLMSIAEQRQSSRRCRTFLCRALSTGASDHLCVSLARCVANGFGKGASLTLLPVPCHALCPGQLTTVTASTAGRVGV